MKPNFLLRRCSTLSLTIVFIFLLSGCGMRYYKSSTVPLENSVSSIEKAIHDNKYFIIHQGDKVWHLDKPFVSYEANQQMFIKGRAEEVAPPQAYMSYKLEKKRKYGSTITQSRRFGPEPQASHQMHLYLSGEFKEENKAIIPFEVISKIDSYDSAVGATIGTHLLLTVAPILFVRFIICNCPYVYSYDSTQQNFEGNLYSGAIYPNLERHDYLTMPDMPLTEGKYKLRFENPKDNEQQFTNYLQLMVVNHADNLKVLPDRKGVLHTIKTPEKPYKAQSSDQADQLRQVVEKDNQSYQFGEYQEASPLNSIVLSFKNNADTKQAKLLLTLKNSDWAAYVYKEGITLFGNKLDYWRKKQMKRSNDEMNERAIEQGTLMSAYLKTKTGWQFIDFINTPGSVAKRDILLPLDLADATSDVEIMLKGGFRFWDLDYAAIDFSKDEVLEVNYLKPELVTDADGKDYTSTLISDDTHYLNQLTAEDKFTITFNAVPRKANLSQTMILDGKGYYKRQDKVEGKVQLSKLLKMRKTGGFSQFSKEKYLEVTNTTATLKP